MRDAEGAEASCVLSRSQCVGQFSDNHLRCEEAASLDMKQASADTNGVHDSEACRGQSQVDSGRS